MENFTITNKTRSKLLNLPFLKIKNAVLGSKYNLSLVFIGQIESKKLNRIYRKKNKPTNVLSFSLSKTEGEIFITPSVAKDHSIGFLFIHGLLHLKGLQHGSTMERAEIKLCKQFQV